MKVLLTILVVLGLILGGYMVANQTGLLAGLGAQPTPATAAKIPPVKTDGW